MLKRQLICWGLLLAAATAWAATNDIPPTPSPAAGLSLPTQPLSLIDCLNLAKDHNRKLLEAKKDLEGARGIAMQTRAILIPHVESTGSYENFDVTTFGGPQTDLPVPNHYWDGSVRVVQSIYEGGRMVSAFRAAKLRSQQALNQYDGTLNDVLREARLGYYRALLARAQLTVLEASLELYEKQVAEARSKVEAGTALRLDLIQAEVELARLRPKLVNATNELRLDKLRLVALLGFKLPAGEVQDVPLELSDPLRMQPVDLQLVPILQQAIARRPEIKALKNAVKLSREEVAETHGKELPSIQVFGGYGGMNDPIDRDLRGWIGGVQMKWEIFDGLQTHGKVVQARAAFEKKQLELEGLQQQIELDVRTAYSNLGAARDTVESLRVVEGQSQEDLRLTRVRYDAGTATPLQVLSAEGTLLETQTATLQALYEYNAALAQLEYATGANLPQP